MLLQLNRQLLHLRSRSYSKTVAKHKTLTLTSKDIRNQFLDYFIQENGHKFVRSSPVVPFCDKSVMFVNAGMNQFKSIFLGKQSAPYDTVANSQKCIRVGGKHNDLSIVGTDGYHHTFFEMLGNWSFGNYFKKEACKYAWNLLTGQYNIDPSRLYVTYFSGNEQLQIEPDIECRDIWRSLGVPESHIIPFGTKENFWEMGPVGPCGPCTEIHIDHLHTDVNRAKFVNCDLPDLTELWNLVFIEYNRNADGTISLLPQKHIDTGMGFERLVAILQEKSSNYGTDLFTPIFDHIGKIAKSPAYQDTYSSSDHLNTSYRILADHSRMITACISDGMFPEQNHKLRRIIRKTLSISEKSFKKENIVCDLIPVIAEILGDTYPEMSNNIGQIQQILRHEQDIYKSLLSTTSNALKEIFVKNPLLEVDDFIDYPGFTLAYKEIDALKGSILPGEVAFKLYDRYGLNEEVISKLAALTRLRLDKDGFQKCLATLRNRSRTNVQINDVNAVKLLADELRKHKITATNNEFKYVYKKEGDIYRVTEINAEVKFINKRDNNKYDIITDKSNFYVEAGGQESDCGKIVNSNAEFIVTNVSSVNDVMVHSGYLKEGNMFCAGSEVKMCVDNIKRTGNILNHTACHILNAAIKDILNCVTYQKSSRITSEQLKLELGVIGQKIHPEQILLIDTLVRKVITSKIPVQTNVTDSLTLYNTTKMTLVPGEIYPETNVRLLSIESHALAFTSKEPCCGTHAVNTSDIGQFSISNVKNNGKAGYIFTAITGEKAKKAISFSNQFLEEATSLKLLLNSVCLENLKTLEKSTKLLKEKITAHNGQISFYVQNKCTDILQHITKEMRRITKESLLKAIDAEMKIVSQTDQQFIIHCLSSDMDSIPLQKATRFCEDKPVILFTKTSDGFLKARCCVPKAFISKQFDAQQWLTMVAKLFNQITVKAHQSENVTEICSMKVKISSKNFEEQLKNAKEKAAAYYDKLH